jgi:hypothetical protein
MSSSASFATRRGKRFSDVKKTFHLKTHLIIKSRFRGELNRITSKKGKGGKNMATKSTAKKAPAKKVYTCKTCGKTTTEKKHLCNPGTSPDFYTCEFCGTTATNPAHICMPKLAKAQFYCGACGRVAVTKALLCVPKVIK